MNKNKLAGIMREHGDTQAMLAAAIGMSLTRLNQKINANGAEFRQGEIAAIRRRYHLSPNDVDQIFFADIVSCDDTKCRD